MDTMSQNQVRKAIVALQIGQSTSLTVAGFTPDQVAKVAHKTAVARSTPITTSIDNGSLVVTRVDNWPVKSGYPEIDKLAVGESHLFALPPRMHQRIRQMASFRNKQANVRLSCLTEADGIRVVRLPLTEDEKTSCVPFLAAPKASKWPMEGLERGERLVFTVTPPEQHKLRLAATYKARTMGWTIRCRLQDDGSMLVYRTDAAAPKQASE